MKAQDWSPSEAIFAFVGWLTTRPEAITLGAHHDAAQIVPLITEFRERHSLASPRPGWEKGIVPPGPPG